MSTSVILPRLKSSWKLCIDESLDAHMHRCTNDQGCCNDSWNYIFERRHATILIGHGSTQAQPDHDSKGENVILIGIGSPNSMAFKHRCAEYQDSNRVQDSRRIENGPRDMQWKNALCLLGAKSVCIP